MTKHASITRRSSRLVIVSPGRRLLLFRYDDGLADSFWATVGGELVGQETYVDAAVRELHEETGFDASIGKLLRKRDSIYAIAQSTPARWLEQYFLVQVESEDLPSRENWTDEERSTIAEFRWWSFAELSTTEAMFKPNWIPDVLESALLFADGG